jgi:hypothetical protein
VPLLAHTEVLNNVQNSNNTGYQKEISSSCNDLKIYWEDLEMLRLILDDVELKLDNREKALAAQQQKLPTRKNWFRRLLGIR